MIYEQETQLFKMEKLWYTKWNNNNQKGQDL